HTRGGQKPGPSRPITKQAVRQTRAGSPGLPPSDLKALFFPKLSSTAICLHEARTASAVSCEFHNLPPTAPDVLKSCLYLFIEQALGTIFRHSAADADVHVCAKSEADKLEIELVSRQHPEGLRVAEA